MTEDIQFVARPAHTPRAGVLVFHGGGGREAHERQQLERFAALGYVAVAPDLFEGPFADRAHGMRVIGELVANPALLRARVMAAFSTLASEVGERRIVAIGHCFGGLAALELARAGAPVRAVVALHGRLISATPATRGDIGARVLACSGADDAFCPPDQRAAFEAEMTAAGVDWQHHVYGGVTHGFSVAGIAQPGCAYNEAADRRSWRAMTELFDEALADT